uniref:Bowman-Birk serine protease inhibitors family domain-containing protein n=1 Tax=Oryza nivara TaxID=4536 RepID=A0A0E0G9W7_ORYNI
MGELGDGEEGSLSVASSSNAGEVTSASSNQGGGRDGEHMAGDGEHMAGRYFSVPHSKHGRRDTEHWRSSDCSLWTTSLFGSLSLEDSDSGCLGRGRGRQRRSTLGISIVVSLGKGYAAGLLCCCASPKRVKGKQAGPPLATPLYRHLVPMLLEKGDMGRRRARLNQCVARCKLCQEATRPFLNPLICNDVYWAADPSPFYISRPVFGTKTNRTTCRYTVEVALCAAACKDYQQVELSDPPRYVCKDRFTDLCKLTASRTSIPKK